MVAKPKSKPDALVTAAQAREFLRALSGDERMRFLWSQRLTGGGRYPNDGEGWDGGWDVVRRRRPRHQRPCSKERGLKSGSSFNNKAGLPGVRSHQGEG